MGGLVPTGTGRQRCKWFIKRALPGATSTGVQKPDRQREEIKEEYSVRAREPQPHLIPWEALHYILEFTPAPSKWVGPLYFHTSHGLKNVGMWVKQKLPGISSSQYWQSDLIAQRSSEGLGLRHYQQSMGRAGPGLTIWIQGWLSRHQEHPLNHCMREWPSLLIIKHCSLQSVVFFPPSLNCNWSSGNFIRKEEHLILIFQVR